MTSSEAKCMAIIPARMGSSRFPGKPLAPVLGVPMIYHVYKRTEACKALEDVYVATCDDEIADAVAAFGGKVIRTSPRHERASDRVAEAAEELDADIIVMVQGDEPLTDPSMIEEAIAPMVEDPGIACVNLAAPIDDEEDYRNPNTIKVVRNLQGDAIYFSRAPIPTSHIQGFEAIPVLKQVCVIPFRREALLAYAKLPSTPLERAESVDMLRFLEHGNRVRLVEVKKGTQAVDTPTDLELVNHLMEKDPFVRTYLAAYPGKH